MTRTKQWWEAGERSGDEHDVKSQLGPEAWSRGLVPRTWVQALDSRGEGLGSMFGLS